VSVHRNDPRTWRDVTHTLRAVVLNDVWPNHEEVDTGNALTRSRRGVGVAGRKLLGYPSTTGGDSGLLCNELVHEQ